ncbi:MAG: short-chain fatty acid transporter [Deltaproteobacteria bacterium HGW-Deltaproteobacteria-10]|nr:MAG: short-chain fatty acid transporter [Deltaproteobacteria bacterium HGW-Deltaproteobacteria-10]
MLRKLASFFTFIMRHYLPDAYLFAIILTFLAAALAWIFTPANVTKVITTWGDGVYGIVAFAMQMILVLVTGYVLALTPPMKKVLDWVAGKASSPVKGAMIVAFVGGVGSWINWGFGLIFAGLLALEVARRNRNIDFPILIGAAYSGFICWHMGFSGSIPLLLATPKHAQNLVEKITGKVVPVADTIFAAWNLFPAAIIIIGLPILFYLIYPKEEDVITISPEKINEMENQAIKIELPAQPTLADRINHSYIVNIVFAAMGIFYLFLHFSNKGLDLNLNIVIFIFFIAGVILHAKPINYVRAVDTAIRSAGGIALQFPLYGGLMGILVGTGLAKVIAGWFVAISSPQTFYMLQFWGAGVINIFVPSGGGQWAVQGPITIEAAKMMNIDTVKSAMMVAWGDQWTNMIQPFWALPLLGLAGLSAKDIMGYTTMTLLWSGLVLSIFALVIGFGIM